MKIQPARRLRGRVKLPGDKSISHRAAMLTGLAAGQSQIFNFGSSADCVSTLACMQLLGVSVERHNTTVTITSAGAHSLRAPVEQLYCGNSGSTMRMLSGVLAGQSFASELTGDASLTLRPMKRIIDPLQQMGATITSVDGHAPLKILGQSPLIPITYDVPVPSAQVKSCVLLAGLLAQGKTTVIERVTTRDHTERMLAWLGVELEQITEPGGVRQLAVTGPAILNARDITVPGDISSAAFFLVAAACLAGSELTIDGVGLNPTRARVVEVMRDLGANIEVLEQRDECGEPVGDLRVVGPDRAANPAALGANLLRGDIIAQLIDELPILAVLGTQLDGGIEIRDAAELRVKESDRISTTVANLRAMGAVVEEYPDGLRVNGPVRLKGAQLEAHDDHRIAMAFAVAALMADKPSEINGAEVVSVSFPEFFQVLESVAQR